MIRIKNLRPGRLFISDAGLKLLPGQVVAVGKLSPQTENLIAKGYVARLDSNSGSPVSGSSVTQNRKTENRETGSEATVPKDYENLHAPEAIDYVEGLNDPQILRAILKEEKRKTVLEALRKRLGEL